MVAEQEETTPVGQENEVGTYFLPEGWHLAPLDPTEPMFHGFQGAVKLTCDGMPGMYVTFEWEDPVNDEQYGGWIINSAELGRNVAGTWEDHEINLYLMPWKELQQGLDQIFIAFAVNPYEM